MDKLGGHAEGIPRGSYVEWLRLAQLAWSEICSGKPLSSDARGYVDRIAAYVDDIGSHFIETSAMAASLGELTEGELALARYFGRFMDDIVNRIRIPGHISAADRFDAHYRLRELHGQRAHARATGHRSAHTENHAIDLNLMQHLAEGLIVVTRDYEIIEEVDACGTVQAPWVRTVGELLEDRVPAGPPFAYNARRRAAKHGARRRADLHIIDQRAEKVAREEQASK
ncbi:hypothetical protein [Sorangium sp. So ce117]|uniref:hypothetical protein n=1 Tax=Sorangium sp. So ce117 TaxID=3133277 RepID=UPI003F5EA3A6